MDIWPQSEDAGFDFAGLLYGVWQDFSATRLGMIVKDSRDHQVAKISYRTVTGPWIFIETPDGKFEADALPALRQSLSLRAARDGSHSLCDFRRLPGGTYRFEGTSLGILESRPPRALHLAPISEYTLNGAPAGASRHIGGWLDQGHMLVLHNSSPWKFGCSFSPATDPSLA